MKSKNNNFTSTSTLTTFIVTLFFVEMTTATISDDFLYSSLQVSNLTINIKSTSSVNSESESLSLNISEELTRTNSSSRYDINTFIQLSRENSMKLIITYTLLYFIGSFGNLFVLYNLMRTRYRSKMNFHIRHLAIADLIVINFTISTEIIWRITVAWITGEFGCKVIQFMRIFGLYLTSMMVIGITLDRFFAFVFPLSIFKSNERNKYLLIASYIISVISSLPNVSKIITLLLFCHFST